MFSIPVLKISDQIKSLNKLKFDYPRRVPKEVIAFRLKVIRLMSIRCLRIRLTAIHLKIIRFIKLFRLKAICLMQFILKQFF